MGMFDKFRNKLHMGSGRAKQRAGRATNDRDLEAKGTSERLGGGARQVGEHAKDAAKDVRDATRP
ncbi:MAG TPA: CsbD family protein [Streptosporangiaceae bacterium]